MCTKSSQYSLIYLVFIKLFYIYLLIYKSTVALHCSSIFGHTTVYDPIQRFINHFEYPCAIVQIQFHPFIWPHFLITFILSNLALCILDLDLINLTLLYGC